MTLQWHHIYGHQHVWTSDILGWAQVPFVALRVVPAMLDKSDRGLGMNHLLKKKKSKSKSAPLI